MLNILNQLWEVFTPLDKRKFIIVLFFTIIMACIEMVGVISIVPFLAVLSNSDIIHQNKLIYNLYIFLGSREYKDFIVQLGAISMGVVIFSALFKIINQYAMSRFSSLQRHYFSTRLLKIYLKQDYEFFIQKNSSELSKNILSEVDQLVNNIIQPILQVISYSFVMFAMFLVVFLYHPMMACLVIIALGSIYTVIFFGVKRILLKIGVEFQLANKGRYKACQEVLSGIKDVKINDASSNYMKNFNHQSRVYAQHLATNSTISQIPLYIVEAVGYCSLITLAIILVKLSNGIEVVLPILGLYGFAAYRMLPAAQNIYRAIAKMKFVSIVFDRIHADLKLKVDDELSIGNIEDLSIKFDNFIELRDVSYAYPSALEKPIFDRFNLVIKKNISFGIIGKSGSGKSTLMDILLGLLSPNKGQLLIDGVEINKYNAVDWQKKIGYVPQFIYLADSTVAENIAFGIEKNQIDMRAVIRAAKIANIDDFIINNLKDGYETRIGERGIMLSGGQRQRIGIARALYKDPAVIFMDEATSALDSETERVLNESIQRLSSDKTLIIIAHRATSLKNCDYLVDLDAMKNKKLYPNN